jgi:homospermidine synthase
MISWDKKIFISGCGSVVQCTLPLLFKLINMNPKNVTIMDFVDNRKRVQDFLDKGVTYIQDKITPENYQTLLSKHLSPGDIFIDLAWNLDTCALLEWCHAHNVLFINTSVEEWDPYHDARHTPPAELTLYHRQMKIKKMIERWQHAGPTAIVDHGANPGLVSHFTKQALCDIAEKIIHEKPNNPRVKDLEIALKNNNFAQLAYLTGTKVIHISERDTQITNKPKQVNEFVNTWSIEGFIEEGMAPAELGWGTHENIFPENGMRHESGPQNQIFLASRGVDTWVRSWVPSGPIIGMVIRHGEAFGISDRLTVWQGDKALYRPTVHYAYHPTDSALNSLHEFKMHHFTPQEKKRILNDDVIEGADELGCLLMGHDYHAWWIGSVLDIHQARKLVPGQNATTVQVAISVVAATIYAINHPNLGVCLPDDIDHTEILAIAKPYLGEFISKPIDWTPLSGPEPYLSYGKNLPAEKDIWQFSTFLVNTDFYK